MASAAIQLAKHAQRLPALLIGAGNSAAVRTCEPPLVAVPVEAVAQCRRAFAAALSFASEATIPLSGFSARFVVWDPSYVRARHYIAAEAAAM